MISSSILGFILKIIFSNYLYLNKTMISYFKDIIVLSCASKFSNNFALLYFIEKNQIFLANLQSH